MRIQDEFTKLEISRQRKWQLRRERDGCCTECGEKVASQNLCMHHLVLARERQRSRNGNQRRYQSLSYLLEKQA